MKKRLLEWFTTVSKKVRDGYNPKSYTWRMVMVPKPTPDSPLPCILMTLTNGHAKILVRFASLEDYKAAFALTGEEEAKVSQALLDANVEADRIEEDMRLLFHRRRLPEGAKIVRTDTGEIIGEQRATYNADSHD